MFLPICKRQEIEQNGELGGIVVALDSFLTRDKPLRLFVAEETLNKPVETKFEQRGVERSGVERSGAAGRIRGLDAGGRAVDQKCL